MPVSIVLDHRPLRQKPVASNTTQLIVAEIAKETAELADSETIKEAITVEIKGIDVKMHEIGVKYKESVSEGGRERR